MSAHILYNPNIIFYTHVKYMKYLLYEAMNSNHSYDTELYAYENVGLRGAT